MLRKLLVVSLACGVVGGAALLTRGEVRKWDRIGWAGLAYQPKVTMTGGSGAGVPKLLQSAFRVQVVSPRSPAARAGIRAGDEIRAIGGLPPGDVEGLRRLGATLRAGDSLSYSVERGGELLELSLTLERPYRSPSVVIASATSAFVGLAFLLISLVVVWSRTRSRPSLVFFFMSLSGAVLFVLWGAGDLEYPNMRGILPTYQSTTFLLVFAVAILLSLVMGNLLLHFSLVFPRARPVLERWPKAVAWLHTLPFLPYLAILVAVAAGAAGERAGAAAPTGAGAATAVAVLLLLALRFLRGGWRHALARSPFLVQAAVLAGAALIGVALRGAPAPTLLRAGLVAGIAAVCWLMVVILAYSVFTCVALYRSYHEAGVEEKHQVRWPLWGSLVSVVGALLVTGVMVLFAWLAPVGATSQYVVRTAGVALSKLLYLLIPISFAFGIVKYRLMDIDVIIRKTVLYIAVTGLVVGSFLVLAATLGLALVRYAGVESPTAAVFVTLLAVAVVIPLRARVQVFVDARLGRHAHDFAESQGRLRRLATRVVTVDEFLHRLVEEVQQTLQCRSVAALRRGAGSETLAVVAAVGIREALLPQLRIPAATALLRERAAVAHVDEAALGEAERRAVSLADAVLAVSAQGGAEGGKTLLLIGRALSREAFNDEEIAYLAAAAETTLLALARVEGKRAEVEFAQARTIQESLLPAELPRIAGVELAAHWRPAREVGGDYFDAFTLAPGKLALCIADVSGKGVPAALLMSNLQALLRAAAGAEVPPDEVCSHVRAGLIRSLAGGRFATLFYGVLETGIGALAYCNAGHNPPLVSRRDGRIEWLDVTGPALARVLKAGPLKGSAVRLDTGDRLVLYTDGVTEALSPEAVVFGEERLVEVLARTHGAAAEASRREITEAVVAFAEREVQDDLAVLVARIPD